LAKAVEVASTATSNGGWFQPPLGFLGFIYNFDAFLFFS
jgi:hypothetical protein